MMADLIEFAKRYLGTKEGTGSFVNIIDGYNSIRPLPEGYKLKYTDSWCAAFASYCLYICGYKSFPFECSVRRMYNKAKAKGLITNVPAVGELVIYDWGNNGTLDHVGIVIEVSSNYIRVIEGNYADAVRIRTISRNNNQIECYVKTGYSVPVPASSITPAPARTGEPFPALRSIASNVIKGKYGNGEERKVKIASAGYNYEQVRAEVNFLSSKEPYPLLKSVALEVLNGKWGNGASRKTKLTLAGYDYEQVRTEVNYLYSRKITK